MSNLTRSAKSSSDWTENEPLAYNIRVSIESPVLFFGQQPDAPLDDLDQQFIARRLDEAPTANVSDSTLRLLQYLDLATRANAGQESATHDFAKASPHLRLRGRQKIKVELPANTRRNHRILKDLVSWQIGAKKDLDLREILKAVYADIFFAHDTQSLTICGDSTRLAQTDVCLVQGGSTVLLILRADKSLTGPNNPEVQVIAEAIAAFQYNNRVLSSAGIPPLDMTTFPVITMMGTRPVFYKVPVTSSLSEAVITGQYPPEETCVSKCVVSIPSRRLSEGMENTDFRKVALQHFITFKDLARSFWEMFIFSPS